MEGQKTRVLVVDDEENILLSLSFLLEREGYEVQTARNGQEAVRAYQQFFPQVIMLDVMMPGMDGFEAAKRIRALDDRSSTHIIFLTAKGTMQDKREGYISGADDYVVKPFDNEVILEKIAEKSY